MSKGSAPKAPDPYQTAAAQTQANRQTAVDQAQLNRVSQVGPLGSMTYSSTPTFNQQGWDAANQQYQTALTAWNSQPTQRTQHGTNQAGQPIYSSPKRIGTAPVAPNRKDFEMLPNYTATTTLPEPAQNALNSQMQMDESLSNLAKNRVDAISQALTQPYDFMPLPNTDREAITSAMMSRMEPQFARDEQSMRQQLNNQGITETSNPEAWGREMERLNQSKNDYRNQAYLSSGQEALRDMQTSLAGRQQQISERMLPANEVGQLLNMSQVQLPNYGGVPQVGMGDVPVGQYMNNAYQGQIANYNAGVGQQNAMLGMLGTIGAAAIPLMSDVRVKEDIREVGEMHDGTPIYTYKYKTGGPHMMGVMAQEVAQTKPHAIAHMGGGMLGVKYGEL
jgi:hypothetical protein